MFRFKKVKFLVWNVNSVWLLVDSVLFREVGNVGVISVFDINRYDIGIVVFFRLIEKWFSRDVF